VVQPRKHSQDRYGKSKRKDVCDLELARIVQQAASMPNSLPDALAQKLLAAVTCALFSGQNILPWRPVFGPLLLSQTPIVMV
jgi:hypothetical protein